MPEEELEGELSLFRVDGNHRLSAAAEVDRDHQRYGRPTPFCIVLQEESADAERWDKVVFHNINARQVPLTSEENLRLILGTGEGSLFTDSALIQTRELGPAYYLSRKLQRVIDVDYLTGLTSALASPCSLAVAALELLMARGVVCASDDTERPRRRGAKAPRSPQESERGVRVELKACGKWVPRPPDWVFVLCDGARGWEPGEFSSWVLKNHIHYLVPGGETQGTSYHQQHQRSVQAVDAPSLVSVFESVLEAKSRTIFVAMAFAADTETTFDTIKRRCGRLTKSTN